MDKAGTDQHCQILAIFFNLLAWPNVKVLLLQKDEGS